MDKIILDNFTLSYKCIGKGRDIVLIHGLAANKGFWNPSIFVPLAREYRVTVLDLRGHGHSDMPAKGYTSADMAGDLQKLLKHLEIRQAHLIGHSFGGMVALHTAVLSPELVRSVILADTRIRVFQPTLTPSDLIENTQITKKLEALGLKIPQEEQESGLWLLEQLALPKWRNKKQVMAENKIFLPFNGWFGGNGSNAAADRWLELISKTSAKKDFTSTAGLTRKKIASIKHPTLVLCGENSAAHDSLNSLKKILSNCDTAIIPNGGHFFPLTHPEEFTKKVMSFLWKAEHADRRYDSRILINLPVSIHKGNIWQFEAATKDASRQGILIEGNDQLEVGSEIEVVPHLQNKDSLIYMKGVVVRAIRRTRNHDYRYGIKLFIDKSDHHPLEIFFTT